MRFVWGKTESEFNHRFEFSLNVEKDCDTLVLCAVDFYQVYCDGKLVSYGPSRTASGYSRKRVIPIHGAKNVVIKTAYYGMRCYACDLQQPFFGAEVLKNKKVIYSTKDFKCSVNSSVLTDLPKYSGQRGYIESFDLTNKEIKPVKTFSVKAPKILENGEDYADYTSIEFEKIEESNFKGFYKCREELHFDHIKTGFDVQKQIIKKDWAGYKYIDYKLPSERTGFFTLKGSSETETELMVFFEELTIDGGWYFRRSGCNDFFIAKIPKGDFSITTFEPYSCRILKVVGKDVPKNLQVGMITLENKNAKLPMEIKDEKLNIVYSAALNTFRQNAVDVFTDCPSRERAGWLCDSYFTGIAEHYFCNNNNIERNYLENIILSKTPEIPNGMLPMCFPAEHKHDSLFNFIPNWALWFIIELRSYFSRTNDVETVKKAKKKVYALLKYFEEFLNEYGLIEDLKGWVFIEWSDCNHPDYTKGVNYPSNMLYAYALDCVAELFGDKKYHKRAEDIRKNIIKLSFDGEFFLDNSIRVDGKLQPCSSHLTETCQYYALFFGFDVGQKFVKKMMEEFGPKRTDMYPNVSRSNVFIGFYLRYLWLDSLGEQERILDECADYFYKMANITGTIWEHDTPEASCNHGFSSVIAKIINNCYN